MAKKQRGGCKRYVNIRGGSEKREKWHLICAIVVGLTGGKKGDHQKVFGRKSEKEKKGDPCKIRERHAQAGEINESKGGKKKRGKFRV